jgi:hypothetical protein
VTFGKRRGSTVTRRRTAARGYDSRHQRLRAALLAAMPDGQPCAGCGRPMFRGQALDLGHDDHDRTRYVGLEHASCNRSRAASSGNRARGRTDASTQRRSPAVFKTSPRVKDYTVVGVDVTDDLETVRIAMAGVVEGGGQAIVDAFRPLPVETAAVEVDRLCELHPIERVVVWLGGNAVGIAGELHAVRPYEMRELTDKDHDGAIIRFHQWTAAKRLLHTGHRDLTAAAQAAKITRAPSGLLRIVRRGSAVDLAVLGCAQNAVWGLPADLSEDGGLGIADVHVAWQPSRDPAALPPHLQEQARLLELGLGPDWPGND